MLGMRFCPPDPDFCTWWLDCLCFLIIRVKKWSRFSLGSHCYWLFSNRKPFTFPFYCFSWSTTYMRLMEKAYLGTLLERSRYQQGRKRRVLTRKPCCPATSCTFGTFCLRLNKLQEPHGRGLLLTQTFLCQGFSPLPLHLVASASRRNGPEDGEPDVLWACMKEPWG